MKKELIIPSVACFSAYINSTPEGADIENTCDWHIHPELELFLLTSGKRIFSIGQENICLSVEDIIFINSRVPHKVYASEGSRGILLQFQTESSTENSFYQNALELLGKREEAFAFFNKSEASTSLSTEPPSTKNAIKSSSCLYALFERLSISSCILSSSR